MLFDQSGAISPFFSAWEVEKLRLHNGTGLRHCTGAKPPREQSAGARCWTAHSFSEGSFGKNGSILFNKSGTS
ncbi:MAG: hypothetical protein NUW13_15515, partial [candidate division KSB1 bacterium]|nr:hypothetical protein [candidate division KSB1 bacterium]